MLKPGSIVIGLLALLCVGEGVLVWRLDDRISRLEAPVSGQPAGRGSAAEAELRSTRTAESVASLEARVDGVQEEVRGILERVPALEGAEGASRGPVLSPSARVALEKHVADLVDRKLDQRLEGREPAEAGPKAEDGKPSIHALSEAVGMTEQQENSAVGVLNEGKKLVFDLLDLPRADGGSLARDLVAALTGGEDQAETWKRFLHRLTTENIPGRSETYLAEVMRIQKAAWDGLGRTLDEKQITRLKRMGIDILEVKTGYEPFEALLADR